MAKKYASCLFEGDLTPLCLLPESMRNTAMCALSSLAKFLGVYGEFKVLVKNFGLKWKDVKPEELLLARISRAVDGQNVLAWVRRVKSRVSRLRVFMDFVALTGLRLEEAVNSYNLIVELAGKGCLHQYYNVENGTLEHFRFRDLFMRRTKKVFVSIVPKSLVEAVASQKEKLTVYKVWNSLKRRGLKCRFPDVREFYANFMTRWLSQSEIDFLQGRISGSVFMRNYFNPALIADLKDRVFKGLAEISKNINF